MLANTPQNEMTLVSHHRCFALVQILTTILVINMVEAAPVTALTTYALSASATMISEALFAPTTTSGYLVIDWQPTTTMTLQPTVSTTQIEPLLLDPVSATTTSSGSANAVSSTWSAASTFSDMSSFSVSAYAAGASNLAILRGSPITGNISVNNGASQPATTVNDLWDNSTNSLQVLYPKGSINPGNSPQGGTEFYARPLDITRAVNASLEYSVFFPVDFDFVKGGKLPGLYGGHKGCSGGNAAIE